MLHGPSVEPCQHIAKQAQWDWIWRRKSLVPLFVSFRPRNLCLPDVFDANVDFRYADMQPFLGDLMAEGFDVMLNLDMGNQPFDCHINLPLYANYNNLKLQIEQQVSTSFGLAVRLPGTAEGPWTRKIK